MTSWFKPLKTDSRKRSLMALLGGVAAIGIAKSVSAQTSAVPLGPSVGNVSGGGGGAVAAVAAAVARRRWRVSQLCKRWQLPTVQRC